MFQRREKFPKVTGDLYELNCYIHLRALLEDYYRILLHVYELQ